MNRSGHAYRRSISRRLAFLAALSMAGLIGITAAWASGTTVVKIIDTHGARILGQQKGYTLYVYCSGANDNCKNGHSASNYYPMVAYHQPVAGSGVNQKKLGTKTLNGQKVVAYYSQPLYRFKGDTKAGMTKGAHGNWFVVSQYGQPVPPPKY